MEPPISETDSIIDYPVFYNSTEIKQDFSYKKFYQKVSFKHCIFDSAGSFDRTSFFNEAVFSNNIFSEHLNFTEANFKGKLYVALSSFKKEGAIIFDGAKLGDTIVFSCIYEMPEIIDLSGVDFSMRNGKRIMLCLYKVDISKIKLDYTHFKLFFQEDSILKQRIEDDEKEGTYQALLSNFNIRGQKESYKFCDIDYQEYKWNKSWASWIAWLPKYWWNFGYNKEYIFIWTSVLLLLFTFVTYFFIYSLNSNVYSMNNISDSDISKWNKKNSLNDFGNRLWYSFIYTASIFFKLTLKLETIKFNHKLGTVYIIIVYILGLICLAYIANFIIQK